jgi:hypothetical protein
MKPIHLFLAFALLTAAGCKDSLDPSQQILGKWQEIARGNEMFPELEPDGHIIEFLPDGTMPGGTYHSIVMRDSQTESYRLDADFLYLGSGKYPDGYIYKYSFTGTDKLRLEIVDGAVYYIYSTRTPKFNIYQRLKNK